MSQFYDQASLVMIPSGYKNGKVYSQKPLSADGELTFTRASNATRVNADGLIEKVRTNLALYSNDFSNAAWTKGGTTSVTPNAGTDPNGGNNAWQVVMSAGGNLYQNSTPNWNGAQSIYAKVASGSASIKMWNGVTGTSFTLTTSWQRLSVVNVNSNQYVNVYNDSASAVTFLVAFAQAETGDIATDYIETTTAAVSVGPVSGLPRLDYSGGCPSLLLEPQRTNQVIYSEYFDASYWTKTNSTIVNNATLSPEGVQNAKELSDNATSGVHYIYRSGISASANHIISFFAKANTLNEVFVNGGASLNAYVDLINGVKLSGTANTTIENYGNGWWRISIISDRDGVLIATSKNGNNNYSGSGESIYIYGIQSEEAASYATSYIPTLGSAVTRLVDSAYKTGVSSLIGQTEGTMFVEFVRDNNGVGVFSINAGNIGNRVYIGTDSSGLISQVRVSYTTQAFFSTPLTIGTTYKCALAYKENDFVLYVNGAQIGTDLSGLVPSSMSIISADAGVSGNDIFCQPLNQALLFKTRLTNAQLAELTTL